MDFKVGDGATICMYSDRHACTVVGVFGKSVYVQRDHAEIVSGSGFDGSAEYEYHFNPDAPVEVFTLRKNGQYVRMGEPYRNGTSLGIGRSEYRDPHF